MRITHATLQLHDSLSHLVNLKNTVYKNTAPQNSLYFIEAKIRSMYECIDIKV
jgi:hypothetical protein